MKLDGTIETVAELAFRLQTRGFKTEGRRSRRIRDGVVGVREGAEFKDRGHVVAANGR